MKRYEVRKRLVGVNEAGKRISPYGSIPPGFKVIQDGWTVYDNHNNTYGLYSMYSQKVDRRDKQAVDTFCKGVNAKLS